SSDLAGGSGPAAGDDRVPSRRGSRRDRARGPPAPLRASFGPHRTRAGRREVPPPWWPSPPPRGPSSGLRASSRPPRGEARAPPEAVVPRGPRTPFGARPPPEAPRDAPIRRGPIPRPRRPPEAEGAQGRGLSRLTPERDFQV